MTKGSYSKKEELANSISHGIGIALSIIALIILVVYASLQGDVWKIVSFGIYGTSLILLYTASTLYHSFSEPRLKHYLKIFDHSAIYLLIAGTYTPFMLVMLRESIGWIIFIAVWILAVIGIFFKLFFVGKFQLLSTIIYLAMGWAIVVAFRPMIEYIPEKGLYWILAGGLSYSLGVVFYLWKKVPYHHAIWHLFVLGGSICHFFAVLFYVLPYDKS